MRAQHFSKLTLAHRTQHREMQASSPLPDVRMHAEETLRARIIHACVTGQERTCDDDDRDHCGDRVHGHGLEVGRLRLLAGRYIVPKWPTVGLGLR